MATSLQLATGATAFAIAFVTMGDVPAGLNALRNVWILIPAITLSNCLALALGLRGTREHVRQFLRQRAFQPALLPAVAVTCVGLGIVLSELDNCILQLIILVTGSNTPPDLIDLTLAPLGAAILLVVVAPVTEEYLFRGLFLRGLLTHYSRFWAVGLSAVAFAVVHLNLRQGLVALIIGVVFGWWYTRTQSVGPGMIGHAIFNSIAWGSAQLPDVSEAFGMNNAGGPVVHAPWWLTLGGLALAGIGIRSFHRQARIIGSDPSPPPLPKAEPPLLFEPPLLNQP